MKKKILAIILIATTTLSLVACKGHSKSAKEETSNTGDENPKISEEEIKKEFSHDFDSETNQQETFYALSYQIPSSWEKKSLGDDKKIYYYPEDGMLMISFSDTTLDFNESGYEEYINSLKNGFDDFVELDHYTTTILDDFPALNLTFTGVIANTPLTAYNIVFSTENQTYSFIYTDYDISTYNRSKDFDAIIDSISYSEAVLNARKAASTPTPQISAGQLNALSSAHDYLDVMPFSYTGLIEQLEYEGYTTEEATYAADNCGADWNEQAALSAQSYLDTMSFSRSGLIDQLLYEGFTQEQAEYGVTSVGY